MPDESSQSEDRTLVVEGLADVDAERLVRDNIEWMLALAERILGDHALAEDVVQDAFIAAFRGLDGFEGRSTLKTWLHRITVNAALTRLRRLKRLAEQPIVEPLGRVDQRWSRRLR